MKNLIFLIFVLVLSSSVFASSSSVEMLLNGYFRDQAAKQIDLLLPRGKYTLQVSVSSDQERIKEETKFTENNLSLPMSTTVISATEMKAISSNGLNDETASKLLSYIKKVDIKVNVLPSITQPVREMIQNSIMTTLALDASRGDAVKVDELPEGFAAAWTNASEFANSTSMYLKPALLIAVVIGLMLLLAAGILYVSFLQFSTKISTEARSMGSVIKEAIETGSQYADQSRDKNSQSEMHAASASASVADSSGFNWEKIDIDTVVSFSLDCLEHPKYASIPVALINSILPSDKSSELEKNLPEMSLEAFLSAGTGMKTAEITALMQVNLAEYRRSTRSPMAKQIIRVPIAKMNEFALTLEKMELALLINALTPIRRSLFLKSMSTQMKLDLAKATSESISALDHKKFEVTLHEKLASLPADTKNSGDTSHSMSYLSQVILKAETFEEDEALHNSSLESGSNYTSVLQALNVFDAQDWEQSNIQDLAMAYAGYSEKIRSEVTEKFNGKKREWFKNFLKKYENSQNELTSPNILAVHDSIKLRITQKIDKKIEQRIDVQANKEAA